MMYELFTGQRPFEGSDQEVLEHHRSSTPKPPRTLNPNLCCSLEHLILKLLDKDPNKRYATARRVRRILASMVPPIGDESLTRLSRPVLVGREEPLQRLIDLWTETKQGQGHLVFITGEAGVGKTRLAQELIQHAGEATVLIGHCREPAGRSAYQPFIDALKIHLTSTPVEQVNQQVGQILDEVGQFIPEVHQLMSQYAIPKPADSETQPSTAKSMSLAHILARTTKSYPWLLILDDLQWADQSSLQLLHYLARHCGQMGLMIVAIYNTSAETDQAEHFADNELLTQLLANLEYETTYTSISLEPLSQGQVKDLLENLWSQEVPIALAAAVYRRTQGNSLFVGEVARGLVDQSIIAWRDGKWRLTSMVEADLPQDIDEAVLRRINRLSKETQTLLYQAATLGLTFSFEDLHEMSDLSEWDALENLEIALEGQLIRVVPNEGILRFKHPEIQRALCKNLSQLKRCLMHREAGEALERRYAAETEAIAPILADHFCQAEVFDKGLKYSLQAAWQARAIYASQTALFWYNQALDVLEHVEQSDETGQQQFELLLARERVYDWQGQRKAQAADLVALQTLAQATDDPARQAIGHNRRAAYERVASRFAQATTAAESGLQAARQAKDSTLEGDSLMQLAHIATSQGDFEAAREHLHAAQKIFAETSQQEEARCLNGLGTVYRRLNDYAQAEDHYQHAIAMNQTIGNWPGLAACLSNLGALYLEIGDYGDAQSSCQQSLEINRLIGHRRGAAICLYHLALIYKAVGHYEMAEQYLAQSLPLRRAIEDSQGEAEDLRALGSIHLARGDYTAARDHIGQALEIFQRMKIYAYEGDTWLVLGQALEGLNDLVKAKHAYDQARTLHQEANNEAGTIEARAGLARCLLTEDKIDEAKAEIEACLTWLKPHAALGINDPVHLYLTAYQVLQAAGETEKAEEVLVDGQALIRHHAENIYDLGLRASFLENVAENKELLAQ
jgi:tetratricopeptide (TPR) repeat protein